jgi:hypothetical protein
MELSSIRDQDPSESLKKVTHVESATPTAQTVPKAWVEQEVIEQQLSKKKRQPHFISIQK